jgi:basic membrane lipoprotein Med (substrate-binding protein (PBP1-ABC) superfamily)
VGWNYGHEQARIITHRKLLENGYSVHVELEQNVDAEAAPAIIDSMGSRGFDVVFLTSSVFAKVISAERLTRWMNTTFIAAIPGRPAASNAVGVNVRVHDARYLMGLMCALATKTNKIGYIIPIDNISSVSQANAFAVGARSVNPNVEIAAVFLNTFYNPLLATKAANYLVDDFGIDCGTAQHDDNSPQKAFNDHGIITTGFNGDMRITTGMNVYFSQMVDYSGFYWSVIQSRLNGNFSSIYGGKAVPLDFNSGLTLSAYSPGS